jgi:small-conductance mechanosensitive channel
MRRFHISPLVRGLLIIAAIALVVMIFELYTTLAVVSGLIRIAFFLAFAFFVYMWWRDHRAEIDLWSRRGRLVFYSAAALIVVDLGAFFSPFRTVTLHGFPALSFVLVLVICAFSMWRVWRDEHTFA